MSFEVKNLDLTKKEGTLLADFRNRYNKLSKFAYSQWIWDKSSIEGQTVPFIIRLISDENLWYFKNFPDIQHELAKLNIVFQYVKYAPKKAAAIWARDYLEEEKKKFMKHKAELSRKWYSTTWMKSPTRESLWITKQLEKFKETYPKIVYRKADTTIDYIKSDWKGYLVSSINDGKVYSDWAILPVNYFFKNPATIKANLKEDIDERVHNKVSKLLITLEQNLNSIQYGDETIYWMLIEMILETANSLTVEGLDRQYHARQTKHEDAELEKRILIEKASVYTFDDPSTIEVVTKSWQIERTEINWDDFDEPIKSKNSDNVSNDFDSFDFDDKKTSQNTKVWNNKKSPFDTWEEINWDDF